MIIGKIDVTKIQKEHLFKGKSGTYLDIALIENKEGQDRYGNNGMIVQSISKEERQKGNKGPILGNYVLIDTQTKQSPAPKKSVPLDLQDDIPF